MVVGDIGWLFPGTVVVTVVPWLLAGLGCLFGAGQPAFSFLRVVAECTSFANCPGYC